MTHFSPRFRSGCQIIKSSIISINQQICCRPNKNSAWHWWVLQALRSSNQHSHVLTLHTNLRACCCRPSCFLPLDHQAWPVDHLFGWTIRLWFRSKLALKLALLGVLFRPTFFILELLFNKFPIVSFPTPSLLGKILFATEDQ